MRNDSEWMAGAAGSAEQPSRRTGQKRRPCEAPARFSPDCGCLKAALKAALITVSQMIANAAYAGLPHFQG